MNKIDVRSWQKSLYVGPPPGPGAQALEQWQRLLKERSMTYVVTLADRRELKKLSPEYAKLLTANEQKKAAKNGDPWEVFEAPIPRNTMPTGKVHARFWSVAYNVAEAVCEGGRVYIHASGDTARLGLFVGVVLRILNVPKRTVAETLTELGVPLETPEQTSMVNAPVPDNSDYGEHFNREFEKDLAESDPDEDLLDYAERIEEQTKESPLPAYIQCDCYLSQVAARDTHSSLKKHGLSSLLYAFSESWQKTGPKEKHAALRALAECDRRDIETVPGTSQELEYYARFQVIARRIGCLKSSMRYSDMGMIVAGCLLLQSVLDDSFHLPLSDRSLTRIRERVHALRLKSERDHVTKRLAEKEVEPLDRSQLDYDCVEAESLTPRQKLDHVARVIDAGVPILDAVMDHYKFCDVEQRRYRIGNIAPNLFAMTEMVVFPELYEGKPEKGNGYL